MYLDMHGLDFDLSQFFAVECKWLISVVLSMLLIADNTFSNWIS